MYEIKSRRLCSPKVVIFQEKLDGFDNLDDLLRVVFIDKECGNFNPSRPNPGLREKIKLNFYFHTSL